ncbi:MAG: hypothetical protein AAGJ34_08920 [Pseudomonadota bacterium]
MSNTDSFIDEVAEEVRNDKLYALFRKYAWIGVLLIIGVVGGAAWSEYSKASRAAAAGAAGDALSTALDAASPSERAAALAAVSDLHPNAAFLAELSRSAELAAAGDTVGADEALVAAAAVAPDTPAFQDFLILRRAMLPNQDVPADDLIARLMPITEFGRPYRLLALEQIAYAEFSDGNADAALSGFTTISQDAEVSEAMRARAEQMILIIGGEPGE